MRAEESRSSLRLWWWRCCFRLGLWLGRGLLGALSAATNIDHRAVATLHFRIHPTQDQHAAIEGDHFAILSAARLVVKMHHDAATGTKRDHVRLSALPGRCSFRARAIFVLVIGGKPPASDDI